MFDTNILLAGAAAADVAALNAGLLVRARPIAFVSPEIVSKDTLARLGYGAVNFHPGPSA